MAILRTVFAVNVCARLVTATSIIATTGVDTFLCDDECSPGTIAVNLRLCRISDADVHALRGCLDGIGRNNIQTLDLGGNELRTLPGDIFEGMTSMTSLHLDMNHLQSLPAEVFEGLDALVELDLHGNPDLQCVYTGSAIPVCESSATGEGVNPAPSGEGNVHLRGRETRSHGQGGIVSRRLPEISLGVLGKTYDVQEHVDATEQEEDVDDDNAAITPEWDSTACLSHWGRPELTDTPDPEGYIIFVNGREQLGGNKFLFSDGLFIAKALGRTLVEYPVKDSRIVGFEDSRHGFGIYWDAMELCMYHRILDLERFRMMAADGRIPADKFVTVTSASHDFSLLGSMKTEDDVVKYFEEYSNSQVIVMEAMWKSGVEREALQYLRPNPFFVGVVRTLIQEQEDWGFGEFVAVQWRTETSTGNLTECYEEVKDIIEQQRIALGYGVHQVFINTDLVAGTSGTFKESQKAGGAELLERVQRDYPAALDNRLHSFTSKITDTGTKAIVAGLAAASSEVMLASSLNGKSHRTDEGAYRCQKVYSGYIHLIAQWREKVMGTPAEGVYRLFPLGDFE